MKFTLGPTMIEARALVLRKRGMIPAFEDIFISEDLARGQVLVKIHSSGLCATQIEEIFTSSRNAKYMPHLFGHEGVGTVVSIGPGVTTKAPGDLCVVHWRKSSVGLDALPGSYFDKKGKINSGPVVTLSEFAVIPENRLTVLPNELPRTPALSLLGCAYPTGWGSVRSISKLAPGETMLLIGAGGVGRSVAASAIASGCSKIFIHDVKPGISGHDAENLGFEFLQNVSNETLKRVNPDVIIDTSGSAELLEHLVDGSTPGTRIVLVGMPQGGRKAKIDTQKLLDGVQILASNGGGVDFGKDGSAIFADYESVDLESSFFSIEQFLPGDFDSAVEHHKNGNAWRNTINFFTL